MGRKMVDPAWSYSRPFRLISKVIFEVPLLRSQTHTEPEKVMPLSTDCSEL
jgi:hypothetical protein